VAPARRDVGGGAELHGLPGGDRNGEILRTGEPEAAANPVELTLHALDSEAPAVVDVHRAHIERRRRGRRRGGGGGVTAQRGGRSGVVFEVLGGVAALELGLLLLASRLGLLGVHGWGHLSIAE